jgi:hypothetical protein
MNTFENKIEYSKKILQYVYLNIDKLEYENFDHLFPILVEKISELKKTRDELILNYGEETVKKSDPELYICAKQIENKFDNIVAIFMEEEKRLEAELSATLSKKKLTAYKR